MADPNPKLKLYSYWRSSCSFRVRIALNLKGLDYEYKAVNLLEGEQSSPEFKDLNPLGYVPVLVDDDVVLADSFAILMVRDEDFMDFFLPPISFVIAKVSLFFTSPCFILKYLEEKYPGRPLLPRDLKKRAINYQVANIVSSNIQPLQNLTILKLIEEKINPDEKVQWAKYHIEKGFQALEKLLKGYAGTYATGDEVGLADVFLAPQLDAAFRRFNVNTDEFPILKRLHDAYFELPEFLNALPEQQPDAPQTCITIK